MQGGYERSGLANALRFEVAHTIGVIDGLLQLYNEPCDMTVEEVDACMVDIERLQGRFRQLSRLIMFKCDRDQKKKIEEQVARDKRKLAIEEAHGIISRAHDKFIDNLSPASREALDARGGLEKVREAVWQAGGGGVIFLTFLTNATCNRQTFWIPFKKVAISQNFTGCMVTFTTNGCFHYSFCLLLSSKIIEKDK